MSPYPIPEKLQAFGFAGRRRSTATTSSRWRPPLPRPEPTKGVPFAIVMKTIKGKGVSYMENQAGWHGKAPNDEEYETAMDELKAQLAEVEAM